MIITLQPDRDWSIYNIEQSVLFPYLKLNDQQIRITRIFTDPPFNLFAIGDRVNIICDSFDCEINLNSKFELVVSKSLTYEMYLHSINYSFDGVDFNTFRFQIGNRMEKSNANQIATR